MVQALLGAGSRAAFALLFSVLALSGASGAENATPEGRPSLKKAVPEAVSRSAEGIDVTLEFIAGAQRLIVSTARTEASSAPAPAQAIEMAQKLRVAAPLLDTFFEGRETGHYLLSVGTYPELTRRLAVAAAASHEWNDRPDAERRARVGDIVSGLLADTALFEEVAERFGAFGFDVSAHLVESVVMCSLGELAEEAGDDAAIQAAITERGASATVPCGATIVFSLD